MSDNLIRPALALAAQGLPVFPSGSRKQPVCPRGHLDATTDPERIRRMFAKPGAVSVSVATGRPSRLIAIDVDPRHGGDLWLREQRDGLPETLTHGTPSGGVHLIFIDPHEAALRCSQGRVAPGVDVRANGGSVIFAGPGYSVRDATPPAEMPAALVRACLSPPSVPIPVAPRRPPIAGDGTTPYGLRALADECATIAAAEFGMQEVKLNTGSWKIGRLVAAGEISQDYALAELVRAGCSMPSQPGHEPWRPADVERKIRRSFADGLRQPRRVAHLFDRRPRP